MEHELKTAPFEFQATWDGRKLFEWRKNDRCFEVGDTLFLREWSPEKGYTRRVIRAKVNYILWDGEFGVPEGYCVMSIQSFCLGVN